MYVFIIAGGSPSHSYVVIKLFSELLLNIYHSLEIPVYTRHSNGIINKTLQSLSHEKRFGWYMTYFTGYKANAVLVAIVNYPF